MFNLSKKLGNVNCMNIQYGLKTIGGRNEIKFCISFASKAENTWNKFYNNRLPYKRWFTNPIFQNRSGYDKILGRYRVWFIFMWHIIQW